MSRSSTNGINHSGFTCLPLTLLTPHPPSIRPSLPSSPLSAHASEWLSYASLYFAFAISPDDNELITLEIIHRYVELLDKYFGSVSKHSYKLLVKSACCL